MNSVSLQKDDPSYPASLRAHLGNRAPQRIFLLGKPELLQKDSLGLFCSIKCPGNVILKTYDLAKALRDAGVPVIGGLHTPMEKECLDLLLSGSPPVVICPAHGLQGMRLRPDVQNGIRAGRVLLVSSFGPTHRRATADLADQRNRLVAALASSAFVSHTAPGGKTEALCREIQAMGKPIFTVDCPENSNLLSLGAKALAADDLSALRKYAAQQTGQHHGGEA